MGVGVGRLSFKYFFPQLHVHTSRNVDVCGSQFSPHEQECVCVWSVFSSHLYTGSGWFLILVPGLHNVGLYQLSHLWF